MVVAAVCPVHGPFESMGFDIQNSRNVTLIGNGETCPVPGCSRLARTMDGTYSFSGNQTVVHQAPDWSVRALTAVTAALGEAIRVAADPDSPLRDVEAAFNNAALLTRLNARDAPKSVKEQLLELLPVKPPTNQKGFRKWAVSSLGAALFLLMSYTDLRDNAIAITNDIILPTANWIIDTVGGLSEESQNVIHQVLQQPDSDE